MWTYQYPHQDLSWTYPRVQDLNGYLKALYTLLSIVSVAFDVAVFALTLSGINGVPTFLIGLVVYTGLIMAPWGCALHIIGIVTIWQGSNASHCLGGFVKLSYLIHAMVAAIVITVTLLVGSHSHNHEDEWFVIYAMAMGIGALLLILGWLIYAKADIPNEPTSHAVYCSVAPHIYPKLYLMN